MPRGDRVLGKAELHERDLWQMAPRSSLVSAVENLARRLNTQRDAVAETPGGFMLHLFSTVRARLSSFHLSAFFTVPRGRACPTRRRVGAAPVLTRLLVTSKSA